MPKKESVPRLPFKPNTALLQAREALKLSQAQVAAAVGVTGQTIGRWERGETEPYPYFHDALCAALQKTAEELHLVERANDSYGDMPKSILLVPSPPTTLVGREDHVSELRKMALTPGIIGISGLPGVGKTTLLKTLANDVELCAHFEAGMLWAALGEEPNISEIISKWAKALGLPVRPLSHYTRQKSIETIRATIGDRRLLLIIDDVWTCDAQDLFALAGKNTTILFTSRMPRLATELLSGRSELYLLPELDVSQGLSLLEILAPQAVALEPQRAQELVRAVGGLPLGLTLMGHYLDHQASTGKHERVQRAVERLFDAAERLRLNPLLHNQPRSQSGEATLSLQSAIDVTGQVLNEDEREALYLLAVFSPKPKSFSLEAALAVTGGSVETLDLLYGLGLLEYAEQDRYTMHLTIADYARLARTPKLRDQAYARLKAYIVAGLEREDRAWLIQESQAILTILDLTLAFHDHEALIDIVIRVGPAIVEEGWLQLASEWLQRACQAARDHQQISVLAWILNKHADVLFKLGNVPRAIKTYDEALQVARSAPNQNELICQILTELAWTNHMYGNYDLAEQYLHEARELAIWLHSSEHLAKLDRVSGAQAWQRGNYAPAQKAFEDGLGLLLQLPEEKRYEISMFYTFIASIEGYRGHYTRAEELFEEAIETANLYGPKDFLIFIEGQRGLIRANHRTDQGVMLDLNEALVLAKKISVMGYSIYVFRALAMWELTQDDPYTAQVLAEKALHLSKSFQAQNRIAEALTLLARIALRLDNDAQAAEFLEQALPLARAHCPVEEIATTLVIMAEVALRSGNLERADEIYQEVQRIAPPEHRVLTASTAYGRSRLAAASGNKKEARLYGKAALRIFEEIQHVQTDEVRDWFHSLHPRWLRVLRRSQPKSQSRQQETQDILDDWEGNKSDD